MKKNIKRAIAAIMSAAILTTGCAHTETHRMTNEEALAETESLLKKVTVNTVKSPVLDIYSDETEEADALADIDTFEMTTTGRENNDNNINIEIAAATEISAGNTKDGETDNWLNIAAERFNEQNNKIGDKTVTVSVRKITSGETVTYIKNGKYMPDVFIPSNDAWIKMLTALGFQVETIEDRILGNTAGILIKNTVYKDFKEKYGEANVKNVMEANNNGDIVFAYTNPYTSSTGLNILASMLKSFDSEDPLSDYAQASLLEYQKNSPPVAYTTRVLSKQAANGVINAMVMEEQAYCNNPALKGFTYVPAGIRHDHPVCVMPNIGEEKMQAAKMFVEWCKSDEMQELGTQKGFNRHNDYKGDSGLDGNGYLSAQKVWKQNKNGGKPTIAVFIADTSLSMQGSPLNSLQSSLIATMPYIGSENYLGLISYNTTVTVNLPINKFDATQRAYFSGEIKNFTAGEMTATYDAVLVGLNMLAKKAEEIPDANLLMFVLTDGDQNVGYGINRIMPIVEGMRIPVYTIAYNYTSNGELETLSDANEAAMINAKTEDIVNELRNLFNAVA